MISYSIPKGWQTLIDWVFTFCNTLSGIGPAFVENETKISALIAENQELQNKLGQVNLARTAHQQCRMERNECMASAFKAIWPVIKTLKNSPHWSVDHEYAFLLHMAPDKSDLSDIFRKVNSDYVYKTTDVFAVDWLKNFVVKLTTTGSLLGIPEADISSLQQLANHADSAVTKFKNAHDLLLKLTDERYSGRLSIIRSISEIVTGLRKSPHWKDSYAVALQIDKLPAQKGINSFKPALWLKERSDCVRVNFVKGNTNGVNIYTRMQGEKDFAFLAYAVRSPFRDPNPLIPGITQVREYQVRGVFTGKEVGYISDVVSITLKKEISLPKKRREPRMAPSATVAVVTVHNIHQPQSKF